MREDNLFYIGLTFMAFSATLYCVYLWHAESNDFEHQISDTASNDFEHQIIGEIEKGVSAR